MNRGIPCCCPHCGEAFVDEDELLDHDSICQFDTEAQLRNHGLPAISPPDPLTEAT